MTLIPDNVKEVFERYISPEVTTILGSQPSTFPLLVYYSAESNKFYFASSPGLSKKFDHMRKNNRVSIFYADPRESGLDTDLTVLVQGTVEIHDDVEKNHKRIWDNLEWYLSRQPASKLLVKPGIKGWLYRKLMWWYPYRILAEMTPTKMVIQNPLTEEEQIIEFTDKYEKYEPKINPKNSIVLSSKETSFISKQPFVTVHFIDTNGFPMGFRAKTNVDLDRIEISGLDNSNIRENQRLCLLAQDFDYLLDKLNYLHIKGHRNGNSFIPTYTHSMFQNVKSLFNYAKIASSETKAYFANQGRDPPDLDIVMSKDEFNVLAENVDKIVENRSPYKSSK